MDETLDLQKTELVFRLIYRSRSTAPPEARAHALAGILHVSRTNNAASGITGFLAMDGDRFAQMLEGPEAAVRALYARIKLDPRHDAVQVRGETTTARVFAHWAMAAGTRQADMPPQSGPAGDGPQVPTREQARILAGLRELTHRHGRGR